MDASRRRTAANRRWPASRLQPRKPRNDGARGVSVRGRGHGDEKGEWRRGGGPRTARHPRGQERPARCPWSTLRYALRCAFVVWKSPRQRQLPVAPLVNVSLALVAVNIRGGWHVRQSLCDLPFPPRHPRPRSPLEVPHLYHSSQLRDEPKIDLISSHVAVFPILADIVKVKTESRSTAHWSNELTIRLSEWLLWCVSQKWDMRVFWRTDTPLHGGRRRGVWEISRLASMERASPDACLADNSLIPACGPCSVDLSDSPDLRASLFQVLGLKVCNAKAHVLTEASMRGVPNRVFLTGGYMGVFFTFLLVKWCPFLRAQIVSKCLL